MAALVGYTGAFAVVLSGLRGVGASPVEAASGLLAVTAMQGLGTVWLSRRHRIPIMLAWSTPGAALLASTGIVHGGWPAAVGAFVIVGVLITLTGLWPRLGNLIASIPTPIAQAMLAGVVLELCLTPVRGFVAHPWEVGPIVIVWLAFRRIAPKWAAPAAFVAALIVIGIVAATDGGVHGSLLPHVIWTTPRFTWAGLLSLALPLYVVTMAGQNVPGTAVLAAYGYKVPWSETMLTTGAGTIAGAFAGGHAINLAAISASLVAAPAADPDPDTRWTAAAAAGWSFLVLALVSGALTTFVSVAAPDVIGAVAGPRPARHARRLPFGSAERRERPRGRRDHIRRGGLEHDVPERQLSVLGAVGRPGGARRGAQQLRFREPAVGRISAYGCGG